jgi:hypothetical protein
MKTICASSLMSLFIVVLIKMWFSSFLTVDRRYIQAPDGL